MPDGFRETKEQRCWWHRMANIRAALPKSAHRASKVTDEIDILLGFADYRTEH